MYKIGVIGERATVAGFIALGYTVHEAETAADAAKILHTLAGDNGEDGYAIIFVTESLAKQIGGDIAKYDGAVMPAVTILPDGAGEDGGLSYGMERIKRNVEVAVGADILFRD